MKILNMAPGFSLKRVEGYEGTSGPLAIEWTDPQEGEVTLVLQHAEAHKLRTSLSHLLGEVPFGGFGSIPKRH